MCCQHEMKGRSHEAFAREEVLLGGHARGLRRRTAGACRLRRLRHHYQHIPGGESGHGLTQLEPDDVAGGDPSGQGRREAAALQAARGDVRLRRDPAAGLRVAASASLSRDRPSRRSPTPTASNQASGYLVTPEGEGPFPVVVYAPGWRTDVSMFLDDATALAKKGYAGLLLQEAPSMQCWTFDPKTDLPRGHRERDAGTPGSGPARRRCRRSTPSASASSAGATARTCWAECWRASTSASRLTR